MVGLLFFLFSLLLFGSLVFCFWLLVLVCFWSLVLGVCVVFFVGGRGWGGLF